ncbi:MAG: phosphoglycerate kinase [Candidatus Pacearchaeota archaeon]|nr:phosphoglycerate kinase [Candidatus Pacearchaeota archaeon]
MESISKADVKNKIILLREDLNSDVENGKVVMSERIKQSAETIKALQKRGAKIVVIAHQGRPGKEDFTSLEQHAKLLNRYVKIKFIQDIIGKKAENAIKELGNGDAILLDNIRKLRDETDFTKKDFVSRLSGWCDIYVNDAFSVCHRKQASIVSFPRHMKSFAGPLLMKETNALKRINLKNCLYILAGAKPEDNIMLMRKNKVLACGLFGQMCLVALGKNLGAQNAYLKKNISDYGKSIKSLKNRLGKMKNLVKLPVDFAVMDERRNRKEIPLENFPSKYEIYDIGKRTQNIFAGEIKKAKSIYMKGPVGYYSDSKFFKGTYAILKAISESRAFSVLGGGQLSDAITKSGISPKKFGHISLSGGALLQYLAGKRLPGLQALGFYK